LCIKTTEKLHIEDAAFDFILELMQEGNEMRHCVGGYAGCCN
jgi:hypothetical protein